VAALPSGSVCAGQGPDRHLVRTGPEHVRAGVGEKENRRNARRRNGELASISTSRLLKNLAQLLSVTQFPNGNCEPFVFSHTIMAMPHSNNRMRDRECRRRLSTPGATHYRPPICSRMDRGYSAVSVYVGYVAYRWTARHSAIAGCLLFGFRGHQSQQFAIQYKPA